MDRQKAGIAALVISIINLLVKSLSLIRYVFYSEVVKGSGEVNMLDLSSLESNAVLCGITVGATVFVIGLSIMLSVLPLILGIIGWSESIPARIAVILTLLPIAITIFPIILFFFLIGTSGPHYRSDRYYY